MATTIPSNRAAFTLAEVAQATGGELIGDAGARVVGVTTDSRAVAPGALFVALVGERLDGHAHATAAVAAGAGALLVMRPVAVDAPRVVVRDTTAALAGLARAHRDRWEARGAGRRIVAITGSAGKTTTRRATAALLTEVSRQVHATTGNLNNAVGAPMTLLGLGEEHDTAVLELGTSSPGEIGHLAEMARAHVGVVTLVAAAHTERLGGLDGVATEKGALLRALPTDGAAVFFADDPRVRRLASESPARARVGFGHGDDADVRVIERRVIDPSRSSITLSARGAHLTFELPLLGRAGALAAAAAVAVAVALGHEVPTDEQATRAFSALADGADGRLAATTLGDGSWLLDDSYNANRASMEASLEAASELARASGRRLVLVLGAMLELGALEDGEHAAVADRARGAGPAVVVAVGAPARVIAERCRDSAEVASVDRAADAVPWLARARRAGDVILVKGSRGVGLDAVADALRHGDPT
ncbi:MAG: UDP-N-acetylmuramoyl-tripeptide--D-alanyl-D-alanine ligase [Polyangiaceae bacterium]|nr:UDP-N-acetylmuramoyl-tripeptide--D-alanyl-D-alanine ligase [Polyangiaceae bacterium]